MNPVTFALRRPMTLLVLVIAAALAGLLAVQRMPRDVFPELGVPTLYVAQPYGGMDPAQMEGFITNYYEYHFLYINGIEHVESRNVQGIALIKLQFHPGTNMAQAMAETVSYVNRSRAFMPTGTIPPFVMRFDAGSVPVGNLVFSSDDPKLGLKDLQDAALFKVRPLFATLPGVSSPPPFGGSARTIVINADPDRLRAYGMSPEEVVAALGKGNTISPSGNVRIGKLIPMVPINSVAPDVAQLENVPIRADGTRTVFVRDIGTVADGSDIQMGYALVNGRRTVYIPVTKRADASTLSVVNLVKENLPKFQSVLPPGVRVSYEFDQSPYVTRAIRGLAQEGLLGAALTGLMVLLFLRDWRSVLVVVLNIPLALLGAVLALWLGGQTVNLMTLGGLALSVGVLVDEATVEVENIHTQFAHSPNIAAAVRAGNAMTAVPRLLAMLCILAVFIPSAFMQGAARSLFVPMSLAVGFAMVGSYLLSSTFVPVVSVWLLRHRHAEDAARHSSFERFRSAYGRFSAGVVRLRWVVVPCYLLAAGLIIVFVGRGLGREIFPAVDAGQFALRLRAPAGTRIEETEAVARRTLDVIAREAGAQNVQLTLGYVGVQASSYPVNVIHLWTSGPEEAYLQVQLKPGAVHVERFKEQLRARLAEALPDVRFSFEPSDIVSRAMSFGSPTPVEVAVSGPDLTANRQYAAKLQESLAKVGPLRDLAVQQELDYPAIKVNFDRQRGGVMGVTADQAARSLADATGSSRFTAPNFWADPKSGVGYQVQVQVPTQRMDSIDQIKNTPVDRRGGQQVLLQQVADVTEGTVLGEYDRYNMQRMLTLGANVGGEDLGRVAARVDRAVKDAGDPPAKVTVAIRGRIATMGELFGQLSAGLGVAVLVIFLMLAANFQSLRLALAVILAVPAVVAGVAVALLLTGTTLNIQSFMGAIMAVGVAVANAILLVTFAERARVVEGMRVRNAAVEGAASRLRPILMTTFAMVAGMVPLAIGLGEGGEQTAPLGRAVIGGLLGATVATLVVLPALFALLQSDRARKTASIDPEDPESPYYAPSDTAPPTSDFKSVEHAGNGAADPRACGATPQRRGRRPGHNAFSRGFAMNCQLSRTRRRILVQLMVAAVAVSPLVARRALSADSAATQSAAPPSAAAAPQASLGPLVVPATIEAFEQADLYPRASGYVAAVSADIGDHVKAGQVLATIDAPELEQDLAQAKAAAVAKRRGVDAAGAGVRQAQQALEVARHQVRRYEADQQLQEVTLKRQEELFTGKAITDQQLDDARAHAEVARADAGVARAKVAAAEADVEGAKAAREVAAAQADVADAEVAKAEALFKYTKLAAPFDGVITRRTVNRGDLAQATIGPRSTPLFTVQRVDTVRIFCDVPENGAWRVTPGTPATIKLFGRAATITGSVTRTAASLHPEARTLRAEIDLPNPNEALLPGSYAQVTLTPGTPAAAAAAGPGK